MINKMVYTCGPIGKIIFDFKGQAGGGGGGGEEGAKRVFAPLSTRITF